MSRLLTTNRVQLVTSHLAMRESTETKMLLCRDEHDTTARSVSFTYRKRDMAHNADPPPLLYAIVWQSSGIDGGTKPSDLYEHRLSDANSDGVTKMEADETHLFDLVIFEFSEEIG